MVCASVIRLIVQFLLTDRNTASKGFIFRKRPEGPNLSGIRAKSITTKS